MHDSFLHAAFMVSSDGSWTLGRLCVTILTMLKMLTDTGARPIGVLHQQTLTGMTAVRQSV